MSNKKEREKRREQRVQEEAKVQSGDRRTKLLQVGAGAVFLVIVAVVVLIVASSGGDSGGDANNLKTAEAESVIAGIPQNGMTLGDPKAPVELIEFGDLQCPACKAYAEEIIPQVIENQVKNGNARITFNNFTIIGEQSLPAGAAALAAGEQGKGWDYLEIFYFNQGEENSGYADDEFLTAVAKAAGVKDIAKWNKERKSEKLIGEVEATSAQAQRYGFSSTPSFAIRGPGTNGTELLGNPGGSAEFEEAIETAAG